MNSARQEPLGPDAGSTASLAALVSTVRCRLEEGQSGQSAIPPVRVLQYAINRMIARLPDGQGWGQGRALPEAFAQLLGGTFASLSYMISSLRRQMFLIVYQPVVDVHNPEHLFHMEALWRFPDQGSPIELIRLAEHVGMIEELDYTVCQYVVEHELAHDGNCLNFPISINISGRSITNPIFIDLLLRLTESSPGITRRLQFSITDSHPVSDLGLAERNIRSLRGLGFKVGLDGLGGDAGLLRYLSALPVDFVKIDGGLVRRFGQSVRDETLLGGIVDICRQLGLVSVATHVETEAQAQRLAALGVQYGQGWFYGRPTPLAVWPPFDHQGAGDKTGKRPQRPFLKARGGEGTQ